MQGVFMCTAVFDNKCGTLFGRTLDLEYSLREEVVICPRNFPLKLRRIGDFERKYAIMGACAVREGVPLFYDGVNEVSLAAAALNFPVSAKYGEFRCHKINLASFELIPYILGNCENTSDVKKCLSEVNITDDAFSEELPPSPLHWIFADRNGSLVAEAEATGLRIYDNPVGVLTNEPSFDFQLIRLADYASLDAKTPKNTLCSDFHPTFYSRGLGGVGLPGDFSSVSRFARAVFVKNHISEEGADGVERFFHIMNSVAMPRGCIITDEGREVETVYTSCIDLDTLTYHYTTYAHSEIRSVSMKNNDIDGNALFRSSMNTEW
jgi:choloylglycine hydrolase